MVLHHFVFVFTTFLRPKFYLNVSDHHYFIAKEKNTIWCIQWKHFYAIVILQLSRNYHTITCFVSSLLIFYVEFISQKKQIIYLLSFLKIEFSNASLGALYLKVWCMKQIYTNIKQYFLWICAFCILLHINSCQDLEFYLHIHKPLFLHIT